MAAMAQYFRRRITGRPIKLDMTSSVEHIRDWMLQEVQYIAAMNETALRQMFSHMWKFSEKWCGVLEPPLPKDLKELQVRPVRLLVFFSIDLMQIWQLLISINWISSTKLSNLITRKSMSKLGIQCVGWGDKFLTFCTENRIGHSICSTHVTFSPILLSSDLLRPEPLTNLLVVK